MYISLNVEITLNEEQKADIAKQIEEQLTNALTDGQIKEAVKEVCKGMIKSVVNECIQTKEYKSFMARKVLKMLEEDRRED